MNAQTAAHFTCNARIMRWVVFLIWPWTFLVQGQVIWSFTEETGTYDAWARDIVETDGGYILLGNRFSGPQGTGEVVLRTLDENGLVVQASSFWQNSGLHDACCLEPSASGDGYIALGVIRGGGTFFRYAFDNALDPLDTTYYSGSGLDLLYMENVVNTGDGRVMLLGGASVPGTFPSRSEFLLLDSAGDALNWQTMESLTGVLMPMHGIHDSSGFIVSTIGSAQVFGNYSVSEFQYLSDDLTSIQGIASPQVWIGEPQNGINARFTDNPCMVPLPSGNLVVSGTYGSLGAGQGGVLVRMSRNGELLGQYFPPHSFMFDHTAALEAIHLDASGDLLYCQVENLQINPNGSGGLTPHDPHEPSRIRVMKLDTAFNVLCEFLIDGFTGSDDAYYIPTRIKPTSDGDILIIGSRKMLNGSNRTALWATKISAEACISGVAESSRSAAAILYPNPGRDHFTLVLNGEAVKGTLLLHDAMGRSCGTAQISHGQAQFEASELPAGVYLYQAMDALGHKLATGKWVKE